MKIHCDGVAIIEKSGTKEQFEVHAYELEWDATGSDEGGMGPSTTFEATIDHDDLGTLTWALVEYPVGAENYRNTDTGEHRLISDLDYGLEHEPDFEPDHFDITRAGSGNLTEWFKKNSHLVRAIPEKQVPDAIVAWFRHFLNLRKTNFLTTKRMDTFTYTEAPTMQKKKYATISKNFLAEEVIRNAVSALEQDGNVEWAPSLNHTDQTAVAKEHEELHKHWSDSIRGSGVHLKREPETLVLNFDSFALALSHLFRTTKGEFSLALLGRWGSGKTSIAKQVCYIATQIWRTERINLYFHCRNTKLCFW